MFSFSEKKFSPVSLWCTSTPNELSVDRLRVTTFREIKLFVVFAFCSFYTVYDSQRSGLHIHSGTGDECDFASANQSGRISLRLMNCPGVGQGHPTSLNMIHFFSFFLFFCVHWWQICFSSWDIFPQGNNVEKWMAANRNHSVISLAVR